MVKFPPETWARLQVDVCYEMITIHYNIYKH